ncbi:MAG: hypothetical protein QOE03_2127 [Micromonosporaceae bacterium]|nr:hypothetical protein [Micromonosporaceae bacterium]
MIAIGTSVGYLVVVTAAVVLLSVPAAHLLVRRRQRAGSSPARAWRATLAEVGMVVGTLPPVWLVLTPADGPSRIVDPLRGLHENLAGGPLSASVQVVGNLFVFAAFGLLGPVRWRIGVREVLLVAAVASVVLEASQYLFDLGRVSDLVDVVLNAGGAGLAAICVRRWWHTGTGVDGRAGAGVDGRAGTGVDGARPPAGRAIDTDPAAATPHRYGEHST